MRLNRPITRGVVVIGLCLVTGTASSGPEGPTPSPTISYQERCVEAMAPVLGLRPEKPIPGEGHLRRLLKLRFASAFRRLELAAERVRGHQDPPEKLFAILEDVGEARLDLSGGSSALILVQEARLGLARVIEEVKKAEEEVGRTDAYELEGARHARLDAEVRLARAKAASKALRLDR